MQYRYLFATLVALALIAAHAGADSLFKTKMAKEGTLVTNKKARFEVGDIISVLVREKIDANTTSNTNTKKESDVAAQAGAAANPFLITPRDENGLGIMEAPALPNWDIQAENEHKGQGSTRRSSSLTTTISCMVVQVLPNDNLMIEGNKQVTVNKEDSTVTIRGLVRSKDITAENTVLSTQVANATVQLKGKGPLWNNQRRGIVTRMLDWFSPF